MTQNASCQTGGMNVSRSVNNNENYQDIVDMVEEANQRQGGGETQSHSHSHFANRQKQPSGTGLRVENLLAPSYDRSSHSNQHHSEPHLTPQRAALWPQYPNFTVSSFNGQPEQTTSSTSGETAGISAHSSARSSTTNSNVHQSSGSRFTVDFSVAGVLRSDDTSSSSSSQLDQRSKLSHFANSEQRHSQQQRSSQS